MNDQAIYQIYTELIDMKDILMGIERCLRIIAINQVHSQDREKVLEHLVTGKAL